MKDDRGNATKKHKLTVVSETVGDSDKETRVVFPKIFF